VIGHLPPAVRSQGLPGRLGLAARSGAARTAARLLGDAIAQAGAVGDTADDGRSLRARGVAFVKGTHAQLTAGVAHASGR
jgi:hypothetical protein